MSPRLFIERTTDTPIKPKNIDGDSAFTGAFGRREQEILALWVVRFCQAKQSWLPFRLDDLENFYEAHNGSVASDFKEAILLLMDNGWVAIEEGMTTLTTAFVAKCYLHAPILGLPRKKRVRKPKAIKRTSRYERLMAKSCI